jgi:hypothetical protein
MERYVAIDNVCAWPNLTMMPDGTIIAAIFNQPTHGLWEGSVDCWASEDDGKTWVRRGTVAPHEPGTSRMNVAAGLARNGDLVVLASGRSNRSPVGIETSGHDGEALPAWVCRSHDGGHTWTHTEMPAPSDVPGWPIVPFGDIVQLPDGELGVSMYTLITVTEHSSYFLTSADDGLTWSCRSTIDPVNANETAPLVLPSGRLLAASRSEYKNHIRLYGSDDVGASWEYMGPVTLTMQMPGHLLLLNDGRLLLSFGIRNPGFMGVGVRISDDDGESWWETRFLADLQNSLDVGYPSSVQTADKTIVTAYYCSGVPAHTRYHMGVVRWNVDAWVRP